MISEFDVFLCHNSEDKEAVIEIAKKLRSEHKIRPWLDDWELQPGLPWQSELEKQINQIKSAAVFIGEKGIGPWQDDEISAFLRQFKTRRCPVIPVLLHNALEKPILPTFLQGMTWVDFRQQNRVYTDPMVKLVWGITGQKPETTVKVIPQIDHDLSSEHVIDYTRSRDLLAAGKWKEPDKKEYKLAVLSIDGGGIKGIVSAMILAEIEKITGKPICELFDFIAGTSTGGILTLGLTKPSEKDHTKPQFTAIELVDLYRNEGKIIFQRRKQKKLNIFDNAKINILKAILNKFAPEVEAEDLFSSKYSREGKDKVIGQYLGNTDIKEALTEILITSYAINFRKPIFFTSNFKKEEEYKTSKFYRVICEGCTMKNVALATSATPTYFKPYYIGAINHPDRAYTLVDGGVFANNPTFIAIIEAMNSYKAKTGKNISLGDLLVVSVGTGRKTRELDIEDIAEWGQIKWVEPLIDIILNSQSEVVDYQMEQLLSSKLQQNIHEPQYYRFQPQYSEMKNLNQHSMGEDDLIYVSDNMDDTSYDNIYNLVKAASRFIYMERSNLARLTNQLMVIER